MMTRNNFLICLFTCALAGAVACAGSPDSSALGPCPTGDRPSPDAGESGASDSDTGSVLERDVAQGGMLWERECASCHARLVFERDSRLFRKYPRLDCPDFLEGVSDGYLHTVIAKGGESVGLDAAMKPFGDKLSSDEIDDLVAFIRRVEQVVGE
jgi:mono/diheme cytochrome c family protein